MRKSSMNEDIKKYPVFYYYKGRLLNADNMIFSTNDYNHSTHNLHHFVEKQHYEKNKNWYEERGIMQKLILMPISMHEQIHNQAIHNLTDAEFLERYKISRWELVFNRKYSKY